MQRLHGSCDHLRTVTITQKYPRQFHLYPSSANTKGEKEFLFSNFQLGKRTSTLLHLKKNKNKNTQTPINSPFPADIVTKHQCSVCCDAESAIFAFCRNFKEKRQKKVGRREITSSFWRNSLPLKRVQLCPEAILATLIKITQIHHTR